MSWKFVGSLIKCKQGKENTIVDALSWRYVLSSTFDTKLFGVEHLKALYSLNYDFGKKSYVGGHVFGGLFENCMEESCEKSYVHDGFLIRKNELCIPHSYSCELFVGKTHCSGLMRHICIAKILSTLHVWIIYQTPSDGLMKHCNIDKTICVLHKHLHWFHLKHEVKKACARCIT